MASRVIEFRTRVFDAIKANIPEFVEVDWYDGLFDEKDVEDWMVSTPAAYVAAVSIPRNTQHTTGEMNADLRIIVTVITEDQFSARDNDEQNWFLMEKLATLANQNKFGDPNAGCATVPMIKRLRDPGLRREGVALGVVEWDSGLTFGTNHAHEFVNDVNTGERIVNMPTMNAFLGVAEVSNRGMVRGESVSLRRPDDGSVYLDEDEV